MSTAPAREPTKLYAIINRVMYPLYDGVTLFTSEDGPTKLYYISDSGTGMPDITRITERGPAQHGDTDVDYLIEPRTVSYIFAVHAPTVDVPADLETARELLLRLFRPSNTPITFRYVRSNGTVRDIDCHVASGLKFATTDREPYTWFQRFNIDMRMADPTFYEPFERSVSFMNPVVEGAGLTVPLAVPVSVRSGVVALETDVFYDGSADTMPIVYLYGPMQSPDLVNTTTGKRLYFPDTFIDNGDTYTIDLRQGYKTVVDSSGTDRTAELSDDSSLDGWSLFVSYDPQHLTFNAVYVGIQPQVARIAYNNRYIGI